MNIPRSIGSALRYILRISHIALWLTIPTALWLWLSLAPEPDPRSCRGYCGWYQGNVLGVSEDTHLLMMFGLFLVGFVAIGCWIAGFCLEITRRVLRGDKSLPPVQLGAIGDGWKLFCSSLLFWLPVIAAFAAFTVFAASFPSAIANVLMLVLIPAWLLLTWGNLVGIARYAVAGQRALIHRRLENTGLALGSLKATILLSFAVSVLANLATGVFAAIASQLVSVQIEDIFVEAALGSFAFFFILLGFSIICSHLMAAYARHVAFCDNLKGSARRGW